MAVGRDQKDENIVTILEALRKANAERKGRSHERKAAPHSNEIICPVAHDLPFLPWKTITNNARTPDGRQFSHHVFDLPSLLELLIVHDDKRHPMTRAPLFLSDINTNLVLHNKTLKFFKRHLRKRNLTYEQFLGELGITPELFAHLCKMRFPAPVQAPVVAEAKAVQNNPGNVPGNVPHYEVVFVKTILMLCLLIIGSTFVNNFSAEDLFKLISNLPSYKEYLFKSILIPIFRDTDLIFDVLIPALPKALEAAIFILEQMTEHPRWLINSIRAIDFQSYVCEAAKLISTVSPGQVVRYAGGAAIGGGVTSLAVKGFQQGRKRQYTVGDPDRHSKKLLALAALGILLLGLDAFTDSIGLVSSISSTSFDRALVLLAPLATTLSAMLFGKATRPSFEKQGELDFEEFKKGRFQYKPNRV